MDTTTITPAEAAARAIEAQHYGSTVREHVPAPRCNEVTPHGRCATAVGNAGDRCAFHGWTPPARPEVTR